MKTILITKEQCSKELGGISAKQVLKYVKTNGLPCVYLSRRTIRFDANAVKKWVETRPTLGKTERMKEGERNRIAKMKARNHQ